MLMSSSGAPYSDLVKPVHARVAGRTRYEVAGLYRSARVQRRLEEALEAHEGIQGVTANTLTGRLLVVYDPSIDPDTIIELIASQLDAGSRLGSKVTRDT